MACISYSIQEVFLNSRKTLDERSLFITPMEIGRMKPNILENFQEFDDIGMRGKPLQCLYFSQACDLSGPTTSF
jgi:hypothetical protein